MHLSALFENEPVRVYVSPYKRALQTLDALGLDDLICQAREEPRPREQDWANFQDTEDIEAPVKFFETLRNPDNAETRVLLRQPDYRYKLDRPFEQWTDYEPTQRERSAWL